MILNIPKPTIEASEAFAERMFSIGDHGMVFDILRNKLYSNPIATICREYACNARDAMRECGKPNEPIQIQLPNSLDPNFRVKDTGVGISPDRIENVFVKYGTSTKRETNSLTGSFGLGAKCAWAATDSFSVITNYNAIQYHYSCIIDETRIGKLITLSETPTEEPNGTTIVIPVKTQDFLSFCDYTEQATRHWAPRPIITGNSKFAWQNITKVLEGTNWAVVSRSSYSYDKHIKLIIDGIEYPLDIDALRTYADCSLIDAIQGTLYLYFDNGLLSLSANREQIQLDQPTQEKIKDHLKGVKDEIKQSVSDKIEALPSLWEANIYLRTGLMSSFYDTKFLGDLTWKDVELTSYDKHGCKVFFFTKGGKFGYSDKITRRDGRYLRFEKNVALYVNDLQLKEPNSKHVEKAFADDPDLKTLQLICPTEDQTIDKLNDTIHLDKLSPKLLSSIATATARKSSSFSGTRLVVFKFGGNFSQVRYDSIGEDPAPKKVLCLLQKEKDWKEAVIGRHPIVKERNITDYDMAKLRKRYPDVSFYGIDEKTPQSRIDEDFADLISLDKFIQDEIIDNTSINYIGIKAAGRLYHSIDHKILGVLEEIEGKIEDPESLFLKRIQAHQKVNDIRSQNDGAVELYEIFNKAIDSAEIDAFLAKNLDYDLDTMNDRYSEMYPLITYVQGYYYTEGKVVNAIVQYVNLIDKANETQQKKAA